MRSALYAVPENFQGVVAPALRATEIHTLGAVLGSTIEQEVVETLNRLRSTTWDADGGYAGYRFVRQAQVFPDVVLKATDPNAAFPILLGIELKGWYVLAKERNPNFRFKATPKSCAPDDMLVVFPWALSQVISGSAQAFSPWIVNSRFAADYRNWHWVHGMGATSGGDNDPPESEIPEEREIHLSTVDTTYPESGAEEHNDEASHDKGGNFGRVARSGLMKDYTSSVFKDEALAGVPLDYWQRFLKMFGNETADERIIRTLDAMANEIKGAGKAAKQRDLLQIQEQIAALAASLDALTLD